MISSMLAHEAVVRLGAFAVVLTLMALAELGFPRRRLTTSKLRRWLSNLGLVGIDALVVRLVFPAAAVGVALWAEQHGWGLLRRVEIPFWAATVLAVVALDFVVYVQHVVFHAIPVLWRLHMVHHADLDFDVTTGNRFHPIEILLSLLVKAGAVLVLGPPAVAVLLFEVILNATAMFNHSNVRIPSRIDRVLRFFLVTPDMHRVHHSVVPVETNSNFGFNLPWWDRLLGTYCAQPREGHEGMTIGLRQFREANALGLPRLLALPFVGDIGSYSFGQGSLGQGRRSA